MNSYTWRYTKDQYYTRVAALENCMPEALKDPIIAHAVAQIKIAELAIDSRVSELCEEEDDE